MGPGVSARVYELEPGFSSLKPAYLGDPRTSPLVLLAAALAVLGLFILVWRLVATLKLIRAAEQVVDAELLDLLYEMGQHYELADVPILKRSDAVQSPCIWGILQPVILVPTSMDLNPSDWRLILEHELAHLRQRDPLRLVIYSVLRYALWWNPLVWLGFKDASLAQEQSIDLSLAGREGYPELLGSHAVPASQPSFSRLLGHGHLLTRVRALIKHPEPPLAAWKYIALAAFGPIFLPLQLVEPYQPDPRQIGYDEVVFVSTRDGIYRLNRMASNGRNPTALPDHFTSVSVPSVSPDGRWIAYNRSRDGKEDIYVAKVDGTGEKLVVATTSRDVQPVWSPDGSKLAFSTLVTGTWEIGMVDLPSGTWRLISSDGRRNLEPHWHSNGERIIFSSHRSGPQKLWSMNLDCSNLVQLTFGGWEDTHGVYSPNGRWVIFSSNRHAKNEATILDLKSGEVQPLVTLNKLDTGEVEFADGGMSAVMTSSDGFQPCVAKIDLRDFRFIELSPAPSVWPTTR